MIKLDPGCVFAWTGKIDVLCKLKKYDEVIKCCNDVLKVRPEGEGACFWVSKGYALKKLNKYDEAIICYDKALKINPNIKDGMAEIKREYFQRSINESSDEEEKGQDYLNGVLGRILGVLDSSFSSDLQSEHHVVAEIYHRLRNLNLSPDKIRIEYPYEHNKKLKCDLVILTKPEVWIEFKGYFSSETTNTRSRKHTAKDSSPFKDCERLRWVKRPGRKTLFIYQNVDFQSKKYPWDLIKKECSKYDILLVHHKVHAKNYRN